MNHLVNIQRKLLSIKEIEHTLIRVGGTTRAYESRQEKNWIEKNLKDLEGYWDNYGNYHVWLKGSCICYCVNINTRLGERNYKIKKDGRYYIAEPDIWEAEKDAGIAILRYMIEKGTPGYYLFLRGEGALWLSKNQPQLFIEKDIYICLNFCNIGAIAQRFIFIDPEQRGYFPAHRLNIKIQNCIGNQEENVEAKKQLETMKYMNSMAMQITINPGVEKIDDRQKLNIKEFEKIALLLLEREMFVEY